MFHWQETASIPEKQRLVEKHFGKKVPQYLFFVIEDISRLTLKEKTMIEQLFGITHSFFSTPPDPDKKNLGYAFNLNTLPENLCTFRILRIRDGTRMHYSFELRDQTCHLIQVSMHSDTGINFLDLWAHPTDDQTKGTVEPRNESTQVIRLLEEAIQIREFSSSDDDEGTMVILDQTLLVPEAT